MRRSSRIPSPITRLALLAALAASAALTPQVALAETAPPGDIPDNQAFVSSRGNGFSLKVPEGWSRTTRGGTTTYADKYNGISVALEKRALAPTVSNVRRSDLVKLQAATKGFARARISGVSRPAGTGVLVRYLASSEPNSVTGKRITLDVERYELWRAGRLLIITLHAPLTPETKNMIGRDELAKMKSSAILINTARGGLVDEEALAEALKNGTIGGAGFDVVTTEPPKNGNILCELDLPNLIVTPHVAWASKQAMQILADQLVDNVEAFVAGKPQNVVEG